jgi:hypothetical protein
VDKSVDKEEQLASQFETKTITLRNDLQEARDSARDALDRNERLEAKLVEAEKLVEKVATARANDLAAGTGNGTSSVRPSARNNT